MGQQVAWEKVKTIKLFLKSQRENSVTESHHARKENLFLWLWQPPHTDVLLTWDPLHAFPEGVQWGQRRDPCRAPALTSRTWNARRLYNHHLLSRTNGTFVWAAPQSSASPQEEKQGLQKESPSDRSRSKSTLSQDEWETIKISTFWIKWKKATKQKNNWNSWDDISNATHCSRYWVWSLNPTELEGPDKYFRLSFKTLEGP